ncbi:MAG: CDC48 family AAA ATPase [Candidatus Aenigmarchaeota archaeon]|nr:CDC48 family AAA ATPase [Candidatus Aenigmarchaeota archaeon]
MEEDLKLKVGELTERGDFGRGIIRISAKDMKRLSITEGDIVEMEGKRKTAAIAVRAYPADVGLDIIRMDGLERRNCGAGIGEPVKIKKADAKEAKAVTIAPARKGIAIHMGGNLLKQNLLMRPLVTGDIIIPNPVVQDRRNQSTLFEQFFGMDFGDFLFTPFGEEKFVVVSTDPKGIVRVTRATDVELLPQATTPLEEKNIPDVTYEDLGGLHDEIQKVREMIELPLKHPELFERLGIEPPKGILLHGPPGCLTGEALVAIEDGRLVRIGELGKNLVPGIYVADLPVYPPAHAKAIHVYDVPETVEVITKSGRRLKMTPNHPLMTDKGWVEAEKLKIGDNVKIFNWLPNPQNYVPTNFVLNEKRLVNEIKVPKIWDEKLAELIGIFVAEGSIDARRIKFTIHRDESELRERIVSLLHEIFSVDVTERVGITKAVRRIRAANRGIWDFFKPLWTKEKVIPQEILLSPNAVASGFLRGLFEGDGSVVKKNRHFDRAVTLKSKSRQLLEEVQVLLLRWAIRSSIYSYKELYGESSVLKIRGRDNLKKYKENIGFISKIKTEKLVEQLSTYKRKTPNENSEFEPVREVRKVNGWERVYDFEVPTTHSFFSNGILSHNTGKTLLAKAVANESGARFIVINGPEVMSKFYGESEENLRKVFEQAEKNAPSIIFIDEIDSIAPKREEVRGEVEKRVVSQMLTLMDGLKNRGKVIVIGATNIPNSLDPALRRPGRFDREIELGVPNKIGRKEILEIHTRGMPLMKDVELDKIAEITYGYVGADIAALCKEAAMHALRRVLPDMGIIKEDKPIPQEVLKKLVVNKEDFDHALKMVEPSAMREVLIEIPNVKWDDIGGLENIKQSLKEVIEWPLKYGESFKRLGIRPPTGVLLYGPPGCGKTLLAKAVANESGANFISVKGPELLSMWVGESERHVRDVFRRAKQVAPAIIFFDEIDALVPRRGYGTDSQVTERVVSQLLGEISGLEDLHDVIVIASTNRPDIIDPALLRPGRFDRQVLVPTPDEKARLEVLKVHTRGMPLANDVNIEKLARETGGFSGADLESLAREAGMHAMRKDTEAKEVTARDFSQALKEIKPSVSEEMNQFYESMIKKRKSQKMEEEILYTG